MEQNFGQRIADLFGVEYTPVSVGVQRGLGEARGDGRAAEGLNGVVTFDKAWLRDASRRDVRGALIHETTHALGVGQRYGNNLETYADYARYMLNPKEAPYWKPSDAVLAMAERRGDVATAPNRPKDGRGPGHRRNTGNNQRSGNGGAVPYTGAPPLPPGQSAAFTGQMAAVQSQYTTALAAIRAQGGAVRGEFQGTMADIQAGRISGTVAAESNALQRGIVGSSADLGARAGVVANAAGQQVDARNAKLTALAGLRVSQMQAGTDYSMGIAGIQADKAAAQAELANQRFMNDMVANSMADYQKLYKDALQRILRQGKNPAGVNPLAGSVNNMNGPNYLGGPAPEYGYDLYHTPGLGYVPPTPQWQTGGGY